MVRSLVATCVLAMLVVAGVRLAPASAQTPQPGTVSCFAGSTFEGGARVNRTVSWIRANIGNWVTLTTDGCKWVTFDREVLSPIPNLEPIDPTDPWAYRVPDSGLVMLQVIGAPKAGTWAVGLYPTEYSEVDDPFQASSAIMWAGRPDPWAASVISAASSRRPLVLSTNWADASTKKRRVTGYRVGISTVLAFDTNGPVWSKTKWTALGPRDFTKVWTKATIPTADSGEVCAAAWRMQVIPLTASGPLPPSPWREVSEGGGC